MQDERTARSLLVRTPTKAKYTLKQGSEVKFRSTPFVYNPLVMNSGGPVFQSAREANMWVMKYEGNKGVTFGFPAKPGQKGSETHFHNQLVRSPQIFWRR